MTAFIYPFHGRNTVAFASSFEAAGLMDRRHEDVVAQINTSRSELDTETWSRWYRSSTFDYYQESGGTVTVDAIDMTFEGFAFLMMRSTGGAATRFMVRYIEQFRCLAAQDCRRYAELPMDEMLQRPAYQVALASMLERLSGFCDDDLGEDD